MWKAVHSHVISDILLPLSLSVPDLITEDLVLSTNQILISWDGKPKAYWLDAFEDKAQIAYLGQKGGIDLNPARMSMQIKKGFPIKTFGNDIAGGGRFSNDIAGRGHSGMIMPF